MARSVKRLGFKRLGGAVLALSLALGLGTGGTARAAGEAIQIPELEWSFEGIFGHFDRASAQRGLQVYVQVCSTCHGLKYIAFRNLMELGYTEDEASAIAAQFTVVDGPDDDGEMFERPAILSDYFPSPFPNDQAARASNGGALPPDLSLIVKAREDGANYVHAILTGYADPPADVELMAGMNYNEYFPGHQIAMAQPLYGDDVEYADGTPASIDQESIDLVQFLTWAAEPSLERRKETGLGVMIFLVVFTGVMFAFKKKIWRDVH